MARLRSSIYVCSRRANSPVKRVMLALCAVFAIGRLANAGTRDIETRHYVMHTDVAPDLAADLARRLDGMYDEYARRLVDFPMPAGLDKFAVFVFENRVDYSKLTGDRFPNTGGIFMPGRNLLAVFLQGQGRDALRRTLQHEAFHQFAYFAISKRLPPWVNEGLAQVFEEGVWQGDGFQLGEAPPWRVRQLHEDMEKKRLTPFETFLPMTDAQWAENLADRGKAARQYEQAWAMCHFLIYAAESDGTPRYRSRLIAMLQMLRDNQCAEAAFTTAFSPNLKGFADRFVEYAAALQPTALASYIERQQVLGDLLISLGARGESFDTVAALAARAKAGSFRLRYTRAGTTWTTDPDPGIYFRDLGGAAFSASDLAFDTLRPAPGAPRDLLLRVGPGFVLRTHFYAIGKSFDCEVVAEAK